MDETEYEEEMKVITDDPPPEEIDLPNVDKSEYAKDIMVAEESLPKKNRCSYHWVDEVVV